MIIIIKHISNKLNLSVISKGFRALCMLNENNTLKKPVGRKRGALPPEYQSNVIKVHPCVHYFVLSEVYPVRLS